MLATSYFDETKPLPIIDDILTLVGAPKVCPFELITDWSRERVVNILSLANQGGVAALYEDDASQKKYGPYTHQRHDFVNSNAHPEYLDTRAVDFMDGYAEAVLRVNSVAFRPKDKTWPWLATLCLVELPSSCLVCPSNWPMGFRGCHSCSVH